MPWSDRILSPPSSLSYWDTQSKNVATVVTDAGAATVGCNRAMVVFTRSTPSGTREDVMTINFHIAKQAAALRTFFTLNADLNAAKTPLTTWITAYMAGVASSIVCKEIRWYIRRHDEDDSGPPIRVDAVGTTGGVATQRNPDQVAMTATFVTASAKHWGRVYLPGISKANIDGTYGRWTSAICDSHAGLLRTLINDENTAGFELGVWSTRANSFLDVKELHVDDVVDIQRRRRAKQKSYTKVYTS